MHNSYGETNFSSKNLKKKSLVSCSQFPVYIWLCSALHNRHFCSAQQGYLYVNSQCFGALCSSFSEIERWSCKKTSKDKLTVSVEQLATPGPPPLGTQSPPPPGKQSKKGRFASSLQDCLVTVAERAQTPRNPSWRQAKSPRIDQVAVRSL